jgi:citronellol/citronellal dehydrogenase
MNYRSVFAPGLFEGQVAIVTGGGSGIGRCCAHELAALGARVVLVGRKAEKLQAVQAEIEEDGGRASIATCDIRSEDAVRATVAGVLATHGRIDALVNNAGGQYIAPLASISAKGWNAVIDTNLTGGFLMARECFTQAMQHQGGAVVNIVADMWGSMPNMGHSGAARAAVAPGYIASSGMDHYPPEAGDMLRAMPRTVPAGRFGTEAETSAAVAFLLSPAAAFISGAVLRVDGARPQVRMGWPMATPDADVRQRAAVRPFDGFHRAVTPNIFKEQD